MVKSKLTIVRAAPRCRCPNQSEYLSSCPNENVVTIGILEQTVAVSPVNEALEQIEQQAGTAFDPALTELFCKTMREQPPQQ
jgi:hypothetical protein